MPFNYNVYFTERDRGRVVRWSPDSGKVDVVAGEPPDGDESQTLSQPYGLAFDTDGCLLIADKQHHRICRLKGGRLEALRLRDANGHRAKRPDSRPGYNPELWCPTGLWMEPGGALLCTFADDYTIYRIQRNGDLELLLGITRNRPYHFTGIRESVPPREVADTPVNTPTGILARSDGTIFFIERIPQAVREYHPARGLRCVFPVSKRLEGSRLCVVPEKMAVQDYHPAFPGSLALDADETLYLTDIYHGCILRVDPGGTLTKVLQIDRKPGMVEGGPAAVAFGPDGTAWVLNNVRQAVEAYAPTPQGRWKEKGVRLTAIGGQPLQLPRAGSGIVVGR